jgi:hypothetical protein
MTASFLAPILTPVFTLVLPVLMSLFFFILIEREEIA